MLFAGLFLSSTWCKDQSRWRQGKEIQWRKHSKWPEIVTENKFTFFSITFEVKKNLLKEKRRHTKKLFFSRDVKITSNKVYSIERISTFQQLRNECLASLELTIHPPLWIPDELVYWVTAIRSYSIRSNWGAI